MLALQLVCAKSFIAFRSSISSATAALRHCHSTAKGEIDACTKVRRTKTSMFVGLRQADAPTPVRAPVFGAGTAVGGGSLISPPPHPPYLEATRMLKRLRLTSMRRLSTPVASAPFAASAARRSRTRRTSALKCSCPGCPKARCRSTTTSLHSSTSAPHLAPCFQRCLPAEAVSSLPNLYGS